MLKTVRKGIFKTLFFIACLIIILSVLAFAGFYRYLVSYGNAPHVLQDPLMMRVERGDSVAIVIGKLYEHGIIDSYRMGLIYYRLFFYDRTLKAGLYNIPEVSSLHSILVMISEGDIATQKITIIEGSTIWDVNNVVMGSQISGKEEFLSICYDREFLQELGIPFSVLEGFLYPDTYIVPVGIDIKAFIRLLTKQAFHVYNEILKTAVHPLEIGDAFILASLIQTESPTRDEGPLIASVFLNRIKIDMLLQCDPTVVYALKRHNAYRGRLLKRDLDFDDPYNTYVYKGYPPSPIASPGYYALFSSMNPADTKYFYFVAKDDKTHVFSKTYREHLENIRNIRRNRK